MLFLLEEPGENGKRTVLHVHGTPAELVKFKEGALGLEGKDTVIRYHVQRESGGSLKRTYQF